MQSDSERTVRRTIDDGGEDGIEPVPGDGAVFRAPMRNKIAIPAEQGTFCWKMMITAVSVCLGARGEPHGRMNPYRKEKKAAELGVESLGKSKQRWESGPMWRPC